MKFLQQLKTRAQFLVKNDRGSTMEDNTNHGAWWVAAIIIFGIFVGVLWFIGGSLLNQAQTGATNLSTNLSTQNGLNKLATNSEQSLSGTSSSTGVAGGTAISGGSYTAP